MLNIVFYPSYLIRYNGDAELVAKIDDIRREHFMNIIDEAIPGQVWQVGTRSRGAILLDADWVKWEIVGRDLRLTSFIHLGLEEVEVDSDSLNTLKDALRYAGIKLGSSALERLAVDIFPTGLPGYGIDHWVSSFVSIFTCHYPSQCANKYTIKAYLEFEDEKSSLRFQEYFKYYNHE